jgi:hypothetical protein
MYLLRNTGVIREEFWSTNIKNLKLQGATPHSIRNLAVEVNILRSSQEIKREFIRWAPV